MWETISSKEIFSHPRLSLIEDEIILPNGIKTKYLKYKDDGGCAVTIIAKRDDGKILLQTEYNYLSNKELFQFPGGGVPAGERPEIGANRELMEEAKLRGGCLELLGSYIINNRRSTAREFIYLATKLEEKSLEGDPEEDIKSFWFSEEEIAFKIKNKEIINIHVLAAWCLYKNK
jgi:8-oxo-dGTP pyrophosphatase MutT (NUDIX family)